MNILFTCAGRRNYLINYFKEALKGDGRVFATDMQRTAPAMADADIAIEVPSIYDQTYIPTLEKIIEEHQIDAIISLNDLELPILAENKDLLEDLGAKVLVSEKEVIDIAFDKWETVKFLERTGLKTPLTYISLDAARRAIDKGELSFPLVIKPRWGSASVGISFPETLRELELGYELQHLNLKRTILSKASQQDIHNAILIQEKLPGKEYGFDILNDFNGSYVGSFFREKLAMRSGETDKALSVVDEQLQHLGKKIGDNLKHIGNLDGDIFEKNGSYY